MHVRAEFISSLTSPVLQLAAVSPAWALSALRRRRSALSMRQPSARRRRHRLALHFVFDGWRCLIVIVYALLLALSSFMHCSWHCRRLCIAPDTVVVYALLQSSLAADVVGKR